MQKPDDIPQSAWDAARKWLREPVADIHGNHLLYFLSYDFERYGVTVLARAIMAATPEWQSMDTAPTDGTKVIVWEEGEMHIGWSSGGSWVCQGDDYNLVVCPSRWMPAPVSPQ